MSETPPAPTPNPAPPVVPAPTPTPAPPPLPAAASFTAPATQEELDRIISTRLAREREKFADYDSLKTKAGELDTLREQQMSQQERAVADARKEAEAAARADEAAKYAERERGRALSSVDVYLDAAKRSGRLDSERHAPVLDVLDKSRFLTAGGTVDAEAIDRFVTSLTGAATPPANPAPTGVPGFGGAAPMWPAMGQGRSETPPAPQVAPGMARLRQAFTPSNQ